MVLTTRGQNMSGSWLVSAAAKAVLLFFMILVAAEANRLQAQERKTVSIAKLGNVLDCVNKKYGAMEGHRPPLPGQANAYRVRYLYGINSPQDENNNELQLVVYGPREKSAFYYRAYLEKNKKSSVIQLGQMATLIQEHRKLELDENPGGNGTYFRIQKAVDFLGRKPALIVPVHSVRPGPATCVF
jgi:hypothetical protein